MRSTLQEWTAWRAWRRDLALIPVAICAAPCFIYALLARLPWTNWLAGVAALGGYLLFYNWVCRRQDAYAADLARRVEASGLIERLATDSAPTERAVDYVHPLLRRFFPSLAKGPASLSQELQMVGSNLEWYLRPPAPLFKLMWVVHPIYIVANLRYSFQLPLWHAQYPDGALLPCLGLFHLRCWLPTSCLI